MWRIFPSFFEARCARYGFVTGIVTMRDLKLPPTERSVDSAAIPISHCSGRSSPPQAATSSQPFAQPTHWPLIPWPVRTVKAAKFTYIRPSSRRAIGTCGHLKRGNCFRTAVCTNCALCPQGHAICRAVRPMLQSEFKPAAIASYRRGPRPLINSGGWTAGFVLHIL